MPQMTYADAIKCAMYDEMRRDSRVFILGQDVQGLFHAAAIPEFGTQRIRNVPISEGAFVGAGIGAALTGMRPIVELGSSTFLYSAMDQIVNQAAKNHYMFGGQASVPLVIRSPVLYTISTAAHHSDRPWALFAQCPGLKIIVPTTPCDAKGLMRSAIRDGNPVLCFDDVCLLHQMSEVPEGDFTIPLGLADVKHVGSDVTLVSIAGAVHHSLAAAKLLALEGISAEVIDIRTVVPLDTSTILESVTKTGHLIVVDPAPRTCSIASEIAAIVTESAFQYLKAPILRLTAPDVPVPYSPELETLMYPGTERIVSAARRTINYSSVRGQVRCALGKTSVAH